MWTSNVNGPGNHEHVAAGRPNLPGARTYSAGQGQYSSRKPSFAKRDVQVGFPTDSEIGITTVRNQLPDQDRLLPWNSGFAGFRPFWPGI